MVDRYYDPEFFTKSQENFIKKVRNDFKKFFKWTEIPDHIAEGLNPKDELEELRNSKLGQTAKEFHEKLIDDKIDKKERNEIQKQLKNLEKAIKKKREQILANVNEVSRIMFNLDGDIEKIRVDSNWHNTSKYTAYYVSYTSILNLKIPQAFIFGRYHHKPEFRKGTKLIAPLDLEIAREIFEKFDEIFDEVSDGLIHQLISLFIKMVLSIDILNQLKLPYDKYPFKNQEEKDFLDKLKWDKELLRSLSNNIVNFGESIGYNVRFVSDVDVSVICIPIKDKTILYVKSYNANLQNMLKVTYLLANVLKKYVEG